MMMTTTATVTTATVTTVAVTTMTMVTKARNHPFAPRHDQAHKTTR